MRRETQARRANTTSVAPDEESVFPGSGLASKGPRVAEMKQVQPQPIKVIIGTRAHAGTNMPLKMVAGTHTPQLALLSSTCTAEF